MKTHLVTIAIWTGFLLIIYAITSHIDTFEMFFAVILLLSLLMFLYGVIYQLVSKVERYKTITKKDLINEAD